MFEWARDNEELYKICTLFNLTELSNPMRFSYKSLKGYIQEGPQCGLVALAMVCNRPTKEFIETLFDAAKKHGYSFNGEIFSCNYMESLAKLFLPLSRIQLFHGLLDCQEIKEHLMKRNLILVPYDTDKDNSPGLHNGHKAHWALICGAVETENNFYTIARHGKAKNLAIWTLKDLSMSNAQLNEFSPDRKLSNVDYKLPDGGVNGKMGLKNMAILIENCPS